MSQMIEPCPFCGGKADTRSTLDTPARWFGLCLSCDAMTGYSTTEEGAAYIWKRAFNPKARLEGLCYWLLHRFGPESPEGREALSLMPKSPNRGAKILKSSLSGGTPAEQQKPISVAQADQSVPIGAAKAPQIFDGHPTKEQTELIGAVPHTSTVTDYAVALVAADCSALICEHTTRLGLDPFAAATVARAVQARIMEIANVC